MTLRKIVHRVLDSGLPGALSAVAAMFGFVLIGYGLAQPPEQGFPSAGEVIAAAPSDNTTERSDPAIAAAPRAVATDSQKPVDALDAPRECAPDQGIDDACTFN